MYGLSTEDLSIQTRARGFADELIPFEEQAEAAGGELPADLDRGQILHVSIDSSHRCELLAKFLDQFINRRMVRE